MRPVGKLVAKTPHFDAQIDWPVAESHYGIYSISIRQRKEFQNSTYVVLRLQQCAQIPPPS